MNAGSSKGITKTPLCPTQYVNKANAVLTKNGAMETTKFFHPVVDLCVTLALFVPHHFTRVTFTPSKTQARA